MLELDYLLAAGIFFGEINPGPVVKDVAVLKNLHKCRALVSSRRFQRFFHVGLEDVHGAGHKCGFRADGKRSGIEGPVGRAERSGFGYLVKFGRRRILALRQAVDAVVEEQHLDADVAAQQVNGVIAADSERVAIAGSDPDFQFGMGNLDPRSDGRGATVNGVESEGVHVIRKAPGAADAGDDDEIFAANAEFRKHRLNRRKNGVVTATRTPADFLVGLKVFSSERRKSARGHCRLLKSQNFFDLLIEFGLLERAALNLVKADRGDKILGAQDPEKLAHIELRHKDVLVALQNVADIGGQGIQIAEMEMANFAAFFALSLDRLGNRAKRGTPGNDQKVTVRIAIWHHVRDVLCDGIDLCGTDAHHVFVVQRLVIDIAGDVLLFQAADAVFESRRARNGPGPRQSLGIALVGMETIGVRGEMNGNPRNFLDLGDAPRLGAVSEVTVRENDDGHHVFQGDAAGFDRDPEAVRGSSGSEHGNGSFGVTAKERLEKIGFVGLWWPIRWKVRRAECHKSRAAVRS